MNAPPVQYVKTSDGYSIAYTTRGNGPLLVCLPFVWSHAQQVWQDSSVTTLLRTLSTRFRVVYFDCRGQGLSQRGLPPDTTVASFLLDLDALLQAMGSGRPILFGDGPWSHAGVRFAAENPDRIAALALMHCPPSFAGHIGGSKILAESNWEYFLSSLAGLAAPREAGDTNGLRARVDGLKARTTQADMLVSMNALEFSNLAELLPRIRVPVLVVHPPEQQWVSQEEASRTAALAPNGRLVVLKGADFFGGVEAANAITSFFEDMQTAVNAKGSEIDEGRHDLSHREVEVLRLVAVGKTNREIADELFISLNTVMRHVSHIYDKAGVSNRAQAAVYARVHGIA